MWATAGLRRSTSAHCLLLDTAWATRPSSLSDLRLSSPSLTAADSLTVTVNVRNTGHRAGAETVQLYIHDDKCSVDRPVKELKGFAKVALQPGESKDVKIVIGRDALSLLR